MHGKVLCKIYTELRRSESLSVKNSTFCSVHYWGKASQFRDITSFMVRHFKFAMKLGMCSIVNVNSSP
jgi:hypothetical protein